MLFGFHLLLKEYFWISTEKVGLRKTGILVAHRECLASSFRSETAEDEEEGRRGRQTMKWGHKHLRGWEVTVTEGSLR